MRKSATSQLSTWEKSQTIPTNFLFVSDLNGLNRDLLTCCLLCIETWGCVLQEKKKREPYAISLAISDSYETTN